MTKRFRNNLCVGSVIFQGPGLAPVSGAWMLAAALVFFSGVMSHTAAAANPSGHLRIEAIDAPNLVVDSNVMSPSSYSPRSAYLGAKFWNDGTNDLTGVYAYIGDYKGGTGDTPGIYPTNKTTGLTGPLADGMFSLTHEGGTSGTADAIRYIGTIRPGESVTVYWLISYPIKDAAGTTPAWGSSTKPDDDLWLNYDVWGTARDDGSPVTADVTRKVTMRNEISAMANKILPNSANKVPIEYQQLLDKYAPSWTNAAQDGTPGTLTISEGVWYDLGNVGAGFDSNGDLIPDRDAWLQPVGDPSSFDSSAFRLVKTRALVVVKLNDGTEKVYNVDNQLYFSNIPENNRGAVGYVEYSFLSMKSGGSCSLSPYQEVASGTDNEKFNGDYGASLGGGMSSGTSRVEMAKSADMSSVAVGSNIAYSISFTNVGTAPVGQPLLSMPLVVQDYVPTGTLYVAGSATNNNSLPVGVSNYATFYSTNSGSSWVTNEPTAATNVNAIQWWLSDAMTTGTYGTVRFAVTVRSPYLPPSPMIVNTGGLSMGSAAAFLTVTAQTLVTSTNRFGDSVFLDNGAGGGTFGNGLKDGSETGISNITVRLYSDVNTNGTLDSGDMLLSTTSSDTNGWYMFTNLFDGKYVAIVDTGDPDLSYGYASTTSTVFSATLNASQVAFTNADFGFAPPLTMGKACVSGSPTRRGSNVTYAITVTNRFAGTGGAYATNVIWATGMNSNVFYTSAGAAWTAGNKSNAFYPSYPDTNFATCTPGGAADTIGLQGYSLVAPSGNITKVELLIPVIVSGTWNDDTVAFYFYTNANGSTPAVYATTNMTIASLTAGTNFFYLDVTTSVTTWAWSKFAAGSSNVIQISCAKLTGPDGGTFGVDQAGFRITSDLIAGADNPAHVLDTVPITDTYNISNLQYLSASRLPDSVTTNGTTGTVYWANAGPVYPGGTSTVSVTFKALNPLDGVMTNVVTNLAYVSGVTYGDGSPANNSSAQATVTVVRAGAIGNLVWWDMDGNGATNAGEMGIPGVSVVMTSTNLPAARTNITDAGGYYMFESLPSNGVYIISVLTNTVGAGITNTADGEGLANNTNNVTVAGLNDYTNANFGYRFLSFSNIIQGSIWNDLNRNGASTPDSGESRFTNVTVFLYTNANATGSAIATNKTDTNGFFRFVGNYSATCSVLVATNTGAMTNRTWAPSHNTYGQTTTNYVSFTNLSSGQIKVADFSFYETGPYSIGDMVFYDWNGNGAQGTNEQGIANVKVSLYVDADTNKQLNTSIDMLVGITYTATNGYLFQNRVPTNYLVIVDPGDTNLPSSYMVTADPYGVGDGMSYIAITNVSKTNQDFGYKPYGSGSFSGTAWWDRDGNGIQNGGSETGLTNIVVTLSADLNEDGNYVVVTSAVTSATGTYNFTNLPDGKFQVTVSESDAAIPRDAFGTPYVPTTATSNSVTITSGDSHVANFGFAALGAIGNTIFWDANTNGTQDTTEQEITNVTVQIYQDVDGNRVYSPGGTDTLFRTTVTDTNGNYLFTAVPTGRYVVAVQHTGPITNAALSADPDADGLPATDPSLTATGRDGQYGLTLAAGQNFMGANFGYAAPGVIGQTLWIDTNTNGIRETTESGIPYISMLLYSNATMIASNETDSDGYYTFANIPDGTNYLVKVSTNDTDFSSTLTQVYFPDSSRTNQASVIISNGTVVSVGGVATNDSMSVNFGYRYAGTNVLSGTVGLDASPYNGVLGTGNFGVGAGEVPYSGVSVYIYLWNDSNSNSILEAGETKLLNQMTTATNGDYSFSGLASGSLSNCYIVSLAAPEDYLRLTTTNGSTSATNVVETLNAQSNTVSAYQVIPVAAATTNMDFAFLSTLSYDYGDLPDSYGTLLPGGARHVVKTGTNLYLGATVDTDSNGNPSQDATGDGADEDGVRLIGVWQSGTNGGQVEATIGKGSGWLVGFADFNGNSNFVDSGEMIINRAVSSTGGNGSGLYTNLFTIPTNSISSTNSTSLYARFRLFGSEPAFPAASYEGTADDGEVEDYFFTFGAVHSLIWNDMNGDGIRDAFEPPISGARLFIDLSANGLYDAGEPFSLSDSSGFYGIGGLSTGTYVVAVDTGTLPAGAVQTYDLDGMGSPNRATISITNGQVRLDADFGYRGNISLGDFVWNDLNTNGVQNGGAETGVSGATVRLYDTGTNQMASTATLGDGSYLFTNLLPGTYFLGFTPAGGYALSPKDQGGDDTKDSDADPVTGYTTTFTLTAGTTNLDWDAGIYSNNVPATVGNYVWRDANLNGQQDAGEPGISNVTVIVYDLGTNVLGTTTTDTNGLYSFTSLADGSYFVGFTAPTGYVFTVATNGAAATDSDVLGTNGWTAAFTLIGGTTNLTVDAGLFDAMPGVQLVLTAGGALDGATLVTNTGSDVTYRYQVINTGNTYLVSMTLTDSVLGVIGTIAGPLAPGATNELTRISSNLVADVTSTGMVAALPAYSNGTAIAGLASLTNTDDAVVDIVSPAVTIVKTQLSPTNRPAVVGETVIFAIAVTNTGDVALDLVPLTDTFDTNYVSFTSALPEVNTTNAGSVGWTNLGPMGVGAGVVVTAQFSAVSSGAWTNIASSIPYTTNGVPGPVSTGSVPAQVVSPGVTIVKTQLSPTNRPAAVGETMIFAIAVTNTGNVVLDSVRVTDAFNTNYVSFLSALPAVDTTNANDVVWTNVGPIAAGASTVVTARFTAVSSGPWTNMAVALPTTTNGMPVTASTNNLPAQVVSPGVTIVKTQLSPTNRPAVVGETVIFTIAVTNTGDVALGLVPVTDTFNTNYVNFVSASPAVNTTNAGNVVWTNLGPLGVGAGTVVTAQFSAVSSGPWTNMVEATPATTNGMPVPTGTSTVPSQVSAPSYLLFNAHTSPTNRPAVVGETITYRVVVTNTGDQGLDPVRLDDFYDVTRLAFVTSSIPWSVLSPGSITWSNLGPLAVGASTNVDLSFTALASTLPGSTTNAAVATVSNTNGIALPAQTNNALSMIAAPSYSQSKVVSIPAGRAAVTGEVVTFTISIANTGDQDLTPMDVYDSYDTNYLSFVTSSIPCSVFSPGSMVWSNIGTLAVGSVTNMTASFLAFTNTSPDRTTNIAWSYAWNTNGVALNVRSNEAPLEIAFYALSKVLLIPTNRPAVPGEEVTFRLSVTNNGTMGLAPVRVDDTYDTNFLLFVTSSIPADVSSPGSLSWTNLGVLGASSVTNVDVTFKALAATIPGVTTNTAVGTVWTTNSVAMPVQTNQVLLQIANLSYSMTNALVSPTNRPAVVGETINFMITVTNTGDMGLSPVQIDYGYNTNYLSFVTSSIPWNVFTLGSITWSNVGVLAAGDVTNINLSFTALASTLPGLATNMSVSTVSSTNGLPLPQQTSSVPVQVVSPGITVAKTLLSPTNRPATIGETVVFMIAVTNTGDVALDTVPITDAFDTNYVFFTSASPAADITNATSVVWTNVGPLGAGASTVVTARFTTVRSGLWTNDATASPSTTNGVPVPASVTNVQAQTDQPPVVDITNVNTTVTYDITTLPVAGTNNPQVVGTMWWTNNLTGQTGTLAAATNWAVASVNLDIGTNIITVYGTNVTGTLTNDSVTYIRGDIGTGMPFIDITDTNTWFTYDTTNRPVNGTNNLQVVGTMWWTNNLTGETGTLAAATSWTNASVNLNVGTNVITVYGTNVTGILTNDSVTYVRGVIGTGLPFIDITDTNSWFTYATTNQPVLGTNNLQVVGTMWWTNNLTGETGTLAAATSWTNAPVNLNVGTNVITVYGTNVTGILTNDSVTFIRAQALAFPFVDITNTNTLFTYDTTNRPVAGTNNIEVVGLMWWTNSLNGQTGTLAAATNWTIASVNLDVGANVIVVYGTNVTGIVTNDTVTYTRGNIGTGLPLVDITNVNELVSYDTTNRPVAGTNNIHVVGTMWWTNAMNGQTGTLAAAASWLIPSVDLAVGTNQITVYGTNELGVLASDTLTLTRLFSVVLTVVSEHGTPVPGVGAWTNAYGILLTNTIDSTVTIGTTQYISSGWSMTSNEPSGGTSNSFVMTQTNDATLSWLWQTNYALSFGGLHGTVTNTTSAGWKPAQSNYNVYPSAHFGYGFDHWNVNGTNAGSVVPLTVLMDEAKYVEPVFVVTFVDVTSQISWNINWVFNPRTGTFFGDLTISNRFDSAKGLLAPVWYEVESNEWHWLRFPAGFDTNTSLHYLDVSTQFTNQLMTVGNLDFVLDPAECITITNIELMGRRMPTGIVVAVWADPPPGGEGQQPFGSTNSFVYDARPDFQIAAIQLIPATPVAGSKFSARVTVTNAGETAGAAGTLSVWTNSPAAQSSGVYSSASAAIGTLAAHSSRVITFTGLAAGTGEANGRTFRAFVNTLRRGVEIDFDNNQATLAYDVRKKPDLTITAIALTPTAPSRGGVFTARVTVRNQGTTNSPDSRLSVWVNSPAALTNSAGASAWSVIGTLSVGQSRVVTLTGLPVSAGTLARRFVAFADSDNILDEISEINNLRYLAYTPVSRPDFVITDITLSTTNPPPGSNFFANITVKNTGYISGNAGYVDIWLDRETNVLPAATLRGNKYQYVGSLNTNMSKLLTFTALPTGTNPVAKVFRAVVDSRAAALEVSETNNQETVNYTVGP